MKFIGFIHSFRDFIRLYTEKPIPVIGILAFFSGIPLLLTGSTLSFWLAQEGLDLTTVGLMGLTALPYTLKFLWAPLVDRLKLPFLGNFLGRRRSWLFLSQLVTSATILVLSCTDPIADLDVLFFSCLILAFAAATQEIVMITYQVERLDVSRYGAGEAMGIFGYRMGLLLAGAGAFYMATIFNWNQVYGIIGVISAFSLPLTLFIAEPNFRQSPEARLQEEKGMEYLHAHPLLEPWQARILGWLYGAVVCPLLDFTRRKGWFAGLLIIFFYKASDNLIGNMSNIFYADLGFSKVEIANASKLFGMWSCVAGGFAGGLMVARMGITRSLFHGALVHGLSLLLHLVLYSRGYDPEMLYIAVGIEHFTGGMRLTALFAFQMSLCSSSYAATQLALCTSLVNLGRTIFSSASGFLAGWMGWPSFFAFAAFLSTPALLLVFWLAHIRQEMLFVCHAKPSSKKKERKYNEPGK